MVATVRTPPVRTRPAVAVRRRRRRFKPTTLAAGLVLAAACVAAVITSQSSRGSSITSGAAAARVGPSVITTAQVSREVDAILGVPSYRRALQNLSTISLSAPVSPKAVAAATGDPDDLLVTFAPANGASSTRPFSRSDLSASVLTRLLYVTSLQQILAERHVQPTAAQITEGRQQAQVEAGVGPNGKSIYDTLPSWYQGQLATRAADVEALAESIAGPSAVTVASVDNYYIHTALSQYTELCLARVGGPLAGAATRTNEGCAPTEDWTPEVAAAVSRLPVGSTTSPLRHEGKTLVLTVTARTIQPLSAVSGRVIAEMLAPYADVVDDLVTTHLGVEKVTVAAQYGTYENLGTTFGVLPLDAMNPPTPLSKTKAAKRTPPPRQQFDPFD